MKVQRIDSSEGNVSKFVFTSENAVAESVLYRYPDYQTRTVICCSTMSGCPIGCRFCGAGDHFVRPLSAEEIVQQVDHCVASTKVDARDMNRFQIMFMSMGEPLLNRQGMLPALRALHEKYPNAELLLSTIGPTIDYEWVHAISEDIASIGLQFSVHQPTDQLRDALIPFEKKLMLNAVMLSVETYGKGTLEFTDVLKRVQSLLSYGQTVIVNRRGMYNDNIQYLRDRKFAGEIEFVVGADTLARIYESSAPTDPVLTDCSFFCYSRPGYDNIPEFRGTLVNSGFDVDVSSSEIRESIKRIEEGIAL